MSWVVAHNCAEWHVRYEIDAVSVPTAWVADAIDGFRDNRDRSRAAQRHGDVAWPIEQVCSQGQVLVRCGRCLMSSSETHRSLRRSREQALLVW